MIFSIALATGLGGCTMGRGDLEQWVTAEKAKKGAPLEPLPVVKTFETFEYRDQDLRDPFSPSPEEQRQAAESSTGSGPQPDQNRVREPLESFPLDSLAMVGTIGVGPAAEQNYGRITAIADDHIELVELVPNGSGGWMERQASIAIGDK